jgi:hypothetical protein
MPDMLESNIMQAIEAAPKKATIQFGLSSVFILSSLASAYLLLAVLSFYYYPQISLLQDCKTMLALVFLVKLLYDLNEVLPQVFQRLAGEKKLRHH